MAQAPTVVHCQYLGPLFSCWGGKGRKKERTSFGLLMNYRIRVRASRLLEGQAIQRPRSPGPLYDRPLLPLSLSLSLPFGLSRNFAGIASHEFLMQRREGETEREEEDTICSMDGEKEARLLLQRSFIFQCLPSRGYFHFFYLLPRPP